jgi:hypothetical protein
VNKFSFRVFKTRFPTYAKQNKIWLKKSVACEAISSSPVIPKVSLTLSFILRVAIVWIKSKSLWVLCISHMWREFQRSSNIQGIDATSGRSSKLNTLRSLPIKTRPEGDMQQTAQCIYRILCECGRSYFDEKGRRLAVRLREHRHNLQKGLLEIQFQPNMPM